MFGFFWFGFFLVILALGYSDCSYHLQKEDRFLPLFLKVSLPVGFPGPPTECFLFFSIRSAQVSFSARIFLIGFASEEHKLWLDLQVVI